VEEQLDLFQLARILIKRKIAVIVGILIGLIIAVSINIYIKPQYEASTQMLFSQGQEASQNQPIQESYQAVLLSERLAQTFSQIISSRTLAERVIDRLKLRIAPEDLEKKVSADPVKDTQLIKLTITDTSPTRARMLANVYTYEFISMTEKAVHHSPLVNISIIEKAAVPSKPVQPKPVLNLILGLCMGFMLGFGFAFLLEMLDTTIKETEEVEKLIGITSLGNVPKISKPLLLDNDNDRSSESFRSIRTNLQYLNFDQSIKTLIVTSPNMGEGKTTTALNLAVVFAQAGTKVLLVDCDLRRPMVGKLFNRDQSKGLSNILVGAAADAGSTLLSTDEEGLHIITSGPIPPNPADLLNSGRMDSLLADLKDQFDLVILDCPPVLGISDTLILASKADAVLAVASFGKTKKTDIVGTRDALGKVGARIVGFIMNGIPYDKRSGYYSYRSYAGHQAVSDVTR